MQLNLSLKKGGKQKRLEPKYIFNLAQFEGESMGSPKMIILVVVIVAIVVLVGKFGVLDRFNALHQKEAEAQDLQQKVEDVHAQIAELQGVTDEYAHYTMDGMEEEELILVNRVDVMGMISRLVLPHATVDSWKLTGNTLVLTISNTLLSRANQIVQAFNTEEMVNFCFMQTAATENTAATDLTAQITAYLQNPEQAAAAEEAAAPAEEETSEEVSE